MLRQAVEEAAASRSGERCCLRFWASCLSSTVAFPCTNVQCLLHQVFVCDPDLLQDLDSFARRSYLERSVTGQGASVSRGRQPRRVPWRSRRKFHTRPGWPGHISLILGLGCSSSWARLCSLFRCNLDNGRAGGMVPAAGCSVILSS